MKKIIIVLCMLLLPLAFVYPQTAVDTVCQQNLENVFKVRFFKNKYETVQYIHKQSRLKSKGFMFEKNSHYLDEYFKLIRGRPYLDKQERSNKIEYMSDEEVSKYLEDLNFSPQDAYNEYRDYIQNIKLEREVYLNCIDAELAKGDTSEYAKDRLYDFLEPGSSIMLWIMKLDFLKVFKEYILNDDNEVLPNVWREKAYLKCGCKI